MKDLIMLGQGLEGKSLEEGKKFINEFIGNSNNEFNVEIYTDSNTSYYTLNNGKNDEIQRHHAKKGDTVLFAEYTVEINDIIIEYVQKYEIIELNDNDEDDLKFIKEEWRVWGYESN